MSFEHNAPSSREEPWPRRAGARMSPPASGRTLGIAGAHATLRVPVAGPRQTVGELRESLLGASFECADDVAVLDGARLVGILPIERLLAAPRDPIVAGLMDPDPPVAAPGVHEERVAWTMVGRGESSVAVTDEHGRFAGLVPPHRMVAVLLAAHDEDIARLGGYMVGGDRARRAAEEPVALRLWHRLPWLLLGLLGAMASGGIVATFEHDLERNVLLAFFVPAVVYMADAVGTQTEGAPHPGAGGRPGAPAGRVARAPHGGGDRR